MSVFSKIKHSRKAAKEHKIKTAEADKPASVPYRHVPTHAAIDALNGAPSGWKSEDLSKIKEHHKRRSQMGISRTHSMLSTTSYMTAAAGPSTEMPPPLPQIDYNNHNSTWFNRDGDLYFASQSPHKRTKRSRHHSYQDSGLGRSPLATEVPSEAVSPVVSSGNSTNSNYSDNLEISDPKQNALRSQPVVYAENDFLEQLHTSTTRKLGEAPVSSGLSAVVRPVLDTAVQDGKHMKARWSLLGKKNSAPIAV